MREEETALLGGLMVHPSQLAEIQVEPSDFSTEEGAEVYKALRSLAGRGVKIDPLILGDEIDARGLAGELAMATCAKQNISHYAGLVRRAAKLRRIVGAAQSVINRSQDKSADPDDLADQLLASLQADSGGRHVWDMTTLMDATMADLRDAMETYASGGQVGITTGFRHLDRMLGGLRGGRLYVFGGRPKMGKTAWALSLQHNAARAGHTVGFASSEMAAKECGTRWLSCASGVDASRIQAGALGRDESTRVTSAQTRLRTLPIHILDQAAVSPARIRLQAMAWKQAYGLDLIVVDYLQRLTPDERGERRDLVVGQMARTFKTLARDLDVPVVLLAQLSRDLERRDDKRPVPSDLRDSGEIEQEADVIGFIYRDWIYNPNSPQDEAEILVRANRHGPAGRATLRFETKFQRWLDMDIAQYEEVA